MGDVLRGGGGGFSPVRRKTSEISIEDLRDFKCPYGHSGRHRFSSKRISGISATKTKK